MIDDVINYKNYYGALSLDSLTIKYSGGYYGTDGEFYIKVITPSGQTDGQKFRFETDEIRADILKLKIHSNDAKYFFKTYNSTLDKILCPVFDFVFGSKYDVIKLKWLDYSTIICELYPKVSFDPLGLRMGLLR